MPTDCGAGSVLPAESGEPEPGSSIHSGESIDAGGITVPSSIKPPDFRNWGGIDQSPEEPSSAVALAPQVETTAPAGPQSAPAKNEHAAESQSAEVEPAAPVAKQESPDAAAPVSRPPADSRGKGRRTRDRAEAGGVSRVAFLCLITYASVMTALALGLGYLLATYPQSQLESLPDVVPKRNEDGEIARTLVPAEAEVPPGHRLRLGQSERFGDVLVTPVRVTRETLGFTHYRGEETRPPAGEVLKLWINFKNVGEGGQGFTPLDSELVFYRVPGSGPLKANNFLARSEGEDKEGRIAIYNHPPHSDWNLAGQELGTVLHAGERWKTYVPTETGVPELEGPLVWRLHLRKGIASNGWGVTTLIEVEFDAAEIAESSGAGNPA